MSSIEIGEYIRTLNGKICKVLSIRRKSRFITNTGHISSSPERYFVNDVKLHSISKPYVKKHSKNIIDLIEVGDYVNGFEVIEIWKEDLEKRKSIFFANDWWHNKEIKSIVTKEMMKSIEYRVE